MNSRFLNVTTSLALLVTAACADRELPTAAGPAPRGRPTLSINDGAHGGNPHFFFLPPIVPAPSPTGTFDPDASPEVRICVINAGVCGTEIAAFSLTSGTGGELVKLEVAGQQYQVNWHTNQFALDLSKQYRIRVLVGSQELGHADVNPIANGQGMKNVDTGENIALKDGSTLPIKFRIEVGAVGPLGPVLPKVIAVASGSLFTCGLVEGGNAYCWGNNQWGALGTGATGPQSNLPVPVTGGHKFIALGAGLAHACGLKASGETWCWGDNADAQLGTGVLGGVHPTPQLVSGAHAFVEISAGNYHNCGRTAAGEVWCWGYGMLGGLGQGSYLVSATPLKVVAPAGTVFTSITAGGGHTCGLADSGLLYCWGSNFAGQVGTGFVGDPVLAPTVAATGYSFAKVFAGNAHTCGLTAVGHAYCWGSNEGGRLGRVYFGVREAAVGPVDTDLSFVTLSLGGFHTCGLTAAGAAYCWGQNDVGQIGVGYASGDPNEPDWSFITPMQVVGDDTFGVIDLGFLQSCAVTVGGVAKCWGSNIHGQLGNADPNPATAPVAVSWPAP